MRVISDHVLRLDQLISDDGGGAAIFPSDETSSSATSSGAESEDDSPRTASTTITTHPAQEVRVNGTAGDLFLMSDILYCHVAAATPRVVVVVVKDAGASQVHAHVFQCPNDDIARTLYAHYKEASNKYKLNRYRNSKRKTDTTQTEAASSSGANKVVTSSNKPPSGSSRVYSSSSLSRMSEGGARGSARSLNARARAAEYKQGGGDGCNVNVIQIREPGQQEGEAQRPWGLVQHTDANGVTHIEIDSGPCSLVSSSSDTSEFSSIISLGQTSPSQVPPPMDPLSPRPHSSSDNVGGILYGNSLGGGGGGGGSGGGGGGGGGGGSLRGNSNDSVGGIMYGNSLGGGSLRGNSNCPNSFINPEREVLVAGEVDKKFRQRQPALLLRREELTRQEASHKAEERRCEDTLRRSDTKREDHRRDKKKREDCRRDDGGGRSRRDWHEGERGGVQELSRPPMEAMIPRLPPERQARPRDQSRGRLRHAHNKGPAPPPPPRRHPENPALLLVPTKNGAENARAFYPKESHIVRGNKIVRVDLPGYRGGWVAHDVNNNPPQYAYYGAAGAWVGAHEYHAVRSRETSTITPEMRRRSRSKSPARRPMAHRYIDAVSTFSLSQKLRDFSDAVFTTKRNTAGGQPGVSGSAGGEVRGHQRSLSSVSAPGGDNEGTLRPVIKKGRRPPEGSPPSRRVTFSARHRA
ncbi:hypothetical protein Hamer_G017449, partial [Homarus americanus]